MERCIMFVKLNSKNLKKLCSLALAGTITMSLTGCNRTVVDTQYGFDKALILGDDSAIILDVAKWYDYSGEQLQLTTDDNMVVLTSSFDTNPFYGNSSDYSVQTVATNAISEDGDLYDLSKKTETSLYNKEFFDTNWVFNRTVLFNGNNALILPVSDWKDYEGEQVQVITDGKLVLNLCSFNSKLIFDVYSDTKASDFAKWYVGEDGNVVDLSASAANSSGFNYTLVDTKYGFNKAIVMKDDAIVILPIDKWCDYEGEQLQLEITDGPTMVTDSYHTILVNDIESELKADQIAEYLCPNGKITDLSAKYKYDTQIYFNGTILDLNNGFTKGIFSNDNTASAVNIDKWNDYEGEQLQIKLDTGDVILASSMLLNLMNGGSKDINASTLVDMYTTSDKVVDYVNGDCSSSLYNKYVFDTEVKFTYALKVVDGNVTIIPLKEWEDFYNTDGKKKKRKSPFEKSPNSADIYEEVKVIVDLLTDDDEKEDSPNCEQLQLTLPDGSVIVTTAYDTVLVNNKTDIKELAEMFRGTDGVISDLTPYVGEPNVSAWNKTLWDTKYNFGYAIFNNESTSQVFPIKEWKDFKEGEQLQLKLNDDTGFLTSFVNTTLVYTKTDGLEETLAAAFNGTLDQDKPAIKVYE